jgi:hypothetical protein
VQVRILIFGLFLTPVASSQTLGGNSVFNFLKLPNTPQLTALGGVNVSQTSNDAGMAFYNPSLLRPSMHTQMNAVFNDFYSGITTYHLSLGYRSASLNTNFLWGVHYFNYGSLKETDPSGNILGSFRPTDWVMQISASRSYLQKWNYGIALKFINSNYGQYRSNGIAADASVLFHDSANLFSASLLAKNMGFQLKTYAHGSPDDLPFDLVAGLSKRLAHAPFSFSITAHHLHQFDIRYNDTSFNNDNAIGESNDKKFVFDKIFRHFVFASQIYIGDNIEVSLAYNYLRRQELNVGKSGNGLNGFSIGVGALFNKIQIRYARAYYQNNTAYNQFGMNLQLNKYFGLGKFGEKIGW